MGLARGATGGLSGGNGGNSETGLDMGTSSHTTGKLGDAEAGGVGIGVRGNSEKELNCA